MEWWVYLVLAATVIGAAVVWYLVNRDDSAVECIHCGECIAAGHCTQRGRKGRKMPPRDLTKKKDTV